jgi:hypothetical protein
MGDWIEAGGETRSVEDGLYIVRGRVWCGDNTLITGNGIFKPIWRREPRQGEKAYRD